MVQSDSLQGVKELQQLHQYTQVQLDLIYENLKDGYTENIERIKVKSNRSDKLKIRTNLYL